MADRWRTRRQRMIHSVRFRLARTKLADDWWEQFERDLSAYADPLAVRARREESGG